MKKTIFKNIKICSLLLILLCFISCGSDDGSSNDNTVDIDTNVDDDTDTDDDTTVNTSISISSALTGSLYIDSQYTNLLLPTQINLAPGTHLLSLGVEGDDEGYYRKEITVEEGVGQDVVFTVDDLAAPRTWRALWINYTTGQAPNGCQTQVSDDFVEIAFNNFMQGIESIERNAFRSVEWDVERLNMTTNAPVVSNTPSSGLPNDWTINVQQAGGVIDDLENNLGMDLSEYDLISIYWPSWPSDPQSNPCNYVTSYGGLAREIRRNDHAIGIVEVPYLEVAGNRFHPDPYTYIHEWIHTIERFYPNHDIILPVAGDGTTAHVNPVFFGFNDVIGLYSAVIRGNVPPIDGSIDFLGTGPEGLWAFNLEDLSRTTSSAAPTVIID